MIWLPLSSPLNLRGRSDPAERELAKVFPSQAAGFHGTYGLGKWSFKQNKSLFHTHSDLLLAFRRGAGTSMGRNIYRQAPCTSPDLLIGWFLLWSCSRVWARTEVHVHQITPAFVMAQREKDMAQVTLKIRSKSHFKNRHFILELSVKRINICQDTSTAFRGLYAQGCLLQSYISSHFQCFPSPPRWLQTAVNEGEEGGREQCLREAP